MLHLRYFIFLMFVLTLVMSGCNNEDEEKLKQFFSGEEGKYSLFVVSDEEFNDIELMKEGITDKLTMVYYAPTMEVVEEEFEFLKIKGSPAYVVFDHEKILYKAYSYEDLVSYLKKNIK